MATITAEALAPGDVFYDVALSPLDDKEKSELKKGEHPFKCTVDELLVLRTQVVHIKETPVELIRVECRDKKHNIKTLYLPRTSKLVLVVPSTPGKKKDERGLLSKLWSSK